MKFFSLFYLIMSSFNCFSTEPVFASKKERGQYYFFTSGCMNCHTVDKKEPLAGGKKIITNFGTFYSPNISPDKNYGIGSWSDQEFLKAVKHGVSPKGDYYYPSFTYTAFSKLKNEDIIAMKTYIETLAPQAKKNTPHELKFPFNQRKLMFAWRALNFRSKHLTENDEASFKYRGTFKERSNESKEWNRGAYLVEATLHCTECHTPRNKLGGLISRKWMTGAPFEDEKIIAGNITNDRQNGLGTWSRDDWKTFLTTGSKPDFGDVGGEMYNIIKFGTKKLSESDLEDVITYLQTI